MLALGSFLAAELYLLALFAVVFLPGVVCLLKGQWLFFALGFVFGGLLWVIVAFRLARPDSWWARRFYEAQKLARARERYPP